MGSNGLELSAIDEYIYTTLAADATLVNMLGSPTSAEDPAPEINIDTIPPTEVYPYVFAQMQASGDSLTSDGTTVLVIADYLIKGVDRAQTYKAITPIAERIYQLLHKSSGVAANGTILKCIRQRQIHFPEITEAVSYRHLGGVYRFWVEGT